MTRFVTLTAALALTSGAAVAAPLGLTATEIYQFDATDPTPGTLDDGLEFLAFGLSADLVSGSAPFPEATGPEGLLLDISWDIADPTGSVGGVLDIVDGGGAPLFDGLATSMGFDTGVIEVLFTDVEDGAGQATADLLATITFSQGPVTGAANPFDSLLLAGDASFHGAQITIGRVGSVIPLPASLPLALGGLVGLASLARRRRHPKT